ncbi:MAG: ferrochelatase [Gammaproteobacteria bacterium]|nr:ferrochelatase [Gammaproteobacteria bacterium]
MSYFFSAAKVRGQQGFQHGREPALGILVVNLGTPDAATSGDVRRYLAEFLSDSRVVEIPRLLWKIILHGIILRVRPAKSARAYQRVWSDRGSPLMVASSDLASKIGEQMQQHCSGRVVTELAMRYGNPSIHEGLEKLQAAGAERLLVLPLYPQYSGATTGTVADAVFKNLMQWRWVPELRMMGAYHDDPLYIQGVADSVRQHWQHNGRGDRLLISFHGMPKATLIAGDPYFCHCHKTARLIAQALDLKEGEWEMAFQSRFGAAEWLQPYSAERWKALPTEGVKHLTVVCPGFAVDCLETLDEIAIEGRDEFLAAGGERFDYVPALNASPAQLELMIQRLISHASGWPELEPVIDQTGLNENLNLSAQLARAAGGN